VCKIPTTLRKHVLQFNDFAASSAQNVIEQMEMPGTLRLQLDMVNNRNLFLKVPFFKNCDLTQIMMLVQLIKKEYVWPGKVVVHENSHTRGLYMVNRGFCKLTTLGEVKELLTYPDFFGDEGLITGATSKTTSTTMTLCEFMVLTTARFESFLDQFIKVKANVQKYQNARARADYKVKLKHQLAKARVELQQCWQKLNHLARAQVVALIELLENRMNAMGQGGTLLAMMKQKTMSKIVRPKKMPPFDNVAGQMRKMSAQLKEGVGNASVIPFPSTREAAYASAHPNPAPAKGDESNGDAPTLQPDLTVEPITPIREESERQR